MHLYELAHGKAKPGVENPNVLIWFDEIGPLNLVPHPSHQWPPTAAGTGDQGAPRQRQHRAIYKRPDGVGHLLAGYDLATDRMYGHVKAHNRRAHFPAFAHHLRSLHPAEQRIAIITDNCSPTAPRRQMPELTIGLRRTTSNSPTCRSRAYG